MDILKIMALLPIMRGLCTLIATTPLDPRAISLINVKAGNVLQHQDNWLKRKQSLPKVFVCLFV